MRELTIENLKDCAACSEGIEWITPLIEAGDIEAVKVALCNERPRWAQWAYKHEFDVLPLDESKRNGSVIVDSDLVFSQTAGDCSTQTAGGRSTQTAGGRSTQTAGDCSTQTAGYCSRHKAGMNSVFICRYYRSGVARVATMISVDDKFWTFNVETERWEHSSDQSEPE